MFLVPSVRSVFVGLLQSLRNRPVSLSNRSSINLSDRSNTCSRPGEEEFVRGVEFFARNVRSMEFYACLSAESYDRVSSHAPQHARGCRWSADDVILYSEDVLS